MERSELTLVELQILGKFCQHKMDKIRMDSEYERIEFRSLVNKKIKIEKLIENKLLKEFPDDKK